MGIGSGEARRAGIEAVAKDAAIMRRSPREAVPRTLARIAMGATTDAPDTSSAMCTAESSRSTTG